MSYHNISRNLEAARGYTFPIAPKFDRHLGSCATEVSVKFPRFQDFMRFGSKTSYHLVNKDPGVRMVEPVHVPGGRDGLAHPNPFW